VRLSLWWLSAASLSKGNSTRGALLPQLMSSLLILLGSRRFHRHCCHQQPLSPAASSHRFPKVTHISHLTQEQGESSIIERYDAALTMKLPQTQRPHHDKDKDINISTGFSIDFGDFGDDHRAIEQGDDAFIGSIEDTSRRDDGDNTECGFVKAWMAVVAAPAARLNADDLMRVTCQTRKSGFEAQSDANRFLAKLETVSIGQMAEGMLEQKKGR
jgi:hypothetical protein